MSTNEFEMLLAEDLTLDSALDNTLVNVATEPVTKTAIVADAVPTPTNEAETVLIEADSRTMLAIATPIALAARSVDVPKVTMAWPRVRSSGPIGVSLIMAKTSGPRITVATVAATTRERRATTSAAIPTATATRPMPAPARPTPRARNAAPTIAIGPAYMISPAAALPISVIMVAPTNPTVESAIIPMPRARIPAPRATNGTAAIAAAAAAITSIPTSCSIVGMAEAIVGAATANANNDPVNTSIAGPRMAIATATTNAAPAKARNATARAPRPGAAPIAKYPAAITTPRAMASAVRAPTIGQNGIDDRTLRATESNRSAAPIARIAAAPPIEL